MIKCVWCLSLSLPLYVCRSICLHRVRTYKLKREKKNSTTPVLLTIINISMIIDYRRVKSSNESNIRCFIISHRNACLSSIIYLLHESSSRSSSFSSVVNSTSSSASSSSALSWWWWWCSIGELVLRSDLE